MSLAHSLRGFLVRMRPSVGSLRGRYVTVATAATLFLVLMTLAGQRQVQHATTRTLTHSNDSQDIRRATQGVAADVWRAENSLEEFLLSPDGAKTKVVRHNLTVALNDTARLAQNPLLDTHRAFREDVTDLARDIAHLRESVATLVALRLDPEKLFPSAPIMLKYMWPAANDFYTNASLAMYQADLASDEPGQTRVYRAFSDARHTWTLMISAFRVWITSRFGIFGEPAVSYKAQIDNVYSYHDAVLAGLQGLSRMEREGTLGFEQRQALAAMRHAETAWFARLKQVIPLYTSDRWRTDTPLLQQTVQPLFDHIRNQLGEIDARTGALARRDAGDLRETAGALSTYLWIVSAIGLLTVLAGFLSFEHMVRRPLARLAGALKDEASGAATSPPLPSRGASEIRELVSAFADMHKQVNARQQRLEIILDNAAEGIMTFDGQGRIESFNHAAEKLFGYAENEVLGHDLTLIIPPDKHHRRDGYLDHFLRQEIQRLIAHEGELLGRHKDGSRFPLAMKVSAMQLDGRLLYTGLVADISERKAMMEHLQQMAEHDGLTGLYNRGYFQSELERVVERARRGERPCAVLYIDLDNFKYVNDTLGHAAGDRLLLDVAAILNQRARKSDLIARFGGDEFTVLLYNAPIDVAERVAHSFRERIANFSFKYAGDRLDIACSIGVARIDADTKSAAEVLSQADVACHLAKRAGRNRVHVFQKNDEANLDSMSADMGWSRRIREAVKQNRFALACQPIIDVKSGAIDSYEVLIRMIDENGELVMPGGFLPSAERFGLAADIDKWVIAHAIATLAEQRKQAPRLRYALNLSGQSLTDQSVIDLIVEQLKRSALEPEALVFEVTETVAIADMAVAEGFLARLQEIGCETALDDFGTGFSSFAYLKDLPVNTVKIDGRFVKNLAASPVDQAMVKAMNEIAHALGKRTVAEFVENEASLALLREYGVDYAQGYHLGRPDVVLPCKAIADRAGDPNLCLIQ